MLKKGKSATDTETEVFWYKNRKTDPINGQNIKTRKT